MFYLAQVVMALFRMTPGYHLYALTYLRSRNAQRELSKLKVGTDATGRAILDMLIPSLQDFDVHYLMPCDTEDVLDSIDQASGKFTPCSVKLKDTGMDDGAELLFEYDFGDDWEVKLKLEKIEIADTVIATDLVKGKGYGIIEDIGGISGLMNYQKQFKAGKISARYRELFDEQSGEVIDPTNFDMAELLADVNDIADEGIYDNFNIL